MRRTLQALLAGFLLVASPLALPAANASTSELTDAYNLQTDAEFRTGLQMRLAWTGDYADSFDGHVGPATLRAIRDFQARNGLPADGVMSEAFLDALIDESDRIAKGAGFDWEFDGETGVRIGLPLAQVARVGRTEVGTMWRSPDEAVEIETVRFQEEGHQLRDVFELLKQPSETRTVTAEEFSDARFILRGEEDGRQFFIQFHADGTDLRGFSVSYPAGEQDWIDRYIVVAAQSFEPYAEPARDDDDIGPMAAILNQERYVLAFSAEDAQRGELSSPGLGAAPGFDASGTGFVVSDDGWILTNAHVANSCKTVLVGEYGAAAEVVIDEQKDLALLRVDADLGEPLPIAAEKPRLGEDILALGFPLRSILADSLNVTRGNISSLMGLMNDPDYLQISAAVQPGNSGGPVVDLAGRVVGVVTAKLNAVAVADLTGDIPQSINFAIRPDAAARFLEANDIDYETADPALSFQSVPDATAKVQESIVPILCLGAR